MTSGTRYGAMWGGLVVELQAGWIPSCQVIRHSGVDSRMIILDDQARQQMTGH